MAAPVKVGINGFGRIGRQVLRAANHKAKMMLISNYPEAQEAAVNAGAMPGFGKREIGTLRVVKLLQEALA